MNIVKSMRFILLASLLGAAFILSNCRSSDDSTHPVPTKDDSTHPDPTKDDGSPKKIQGLGAHDKDWDENYTHFEGDERESGTGYKKEDGSEVYYTECEMDKLLDLIGAPLADAQLQIRSVTDNIRVIKPGDLITMDHHPERLNIYIDKHAIVTKFRCG